MGKSYKKVHISGIAGGSDKVGKRLANRALRKAVKNRLSTIDFDETVELDIREVSDNYSFSKDGKVYRRPLYDYNYTEEDIKKEMRK